MTAILEVQAGSMLTYKALLTSRRDEMISLLITVHHMPPIRAEAMVDQYWDLAVAGVIKDNDQNEFWAPAISGIFGDTPPADPDRALAELVVNEALGFLQASEHNSGLGPSLMVDWGWHALKDWTMLYDAFCVAMFGRYLHHEPSGLLVLPDGYVDAWPTFTLDDTVLAMHEQGPVLDLLWITCGKCGNPCDGCCRTRCKRA